MDKQTETEAAKFKLKNSILIFLFALIMPPILFCFWTLLLILSAMGLDFEAANIIQIAGVISVVLYILILFFTGWKVHKKRGFKSSFLEVIVPSAIAVCLLAIIYNIYYRVAFPDHSKIEIDKISIIPERICYYKSENNYLNNLRWEGKIIAPKGFELYRNELMTTAGYYNGKNYIDDSFNNKDFIFDGNAKKFRVDFPVGVEFFSDYLDNYNNPGFTGKLRNIYFTIGSEKVYRLLLTNDFEKNMARVYRIKDAQPYCENLNQ